MTRPMLARVLALAVVSFLPIGVRADATGDVVLELDGLRSDRGEVRGALYASADGWTSEGREIASCRAHVERRRARCVFVGVAPGAYAVALLHDEDDDGHMDRDLFGLPQEGYAFSNDAAPSLGPPSFTSARFVHEAAESILHVHARYGI